MMKIIKLPACYVRYCMLVMLFGMRGIITILRMGYFTGILKES